MCQHGRAERTALPDIGEVQAKREVVVTTANVTEEGRRPLRADVPPELWKRVKIRAVEEELSMREYIITALERDLNAKDTTREGEGKSER